MFDKRILIPAMGLLLLSGCDSGQPETAAGQGGGEVLPGTISDDMLPYDSVTSQPPLMAPEPTGSGAGAAAAAEETEAQEEESADVAADPAPTLSATE